MLISKKRIYSLTKYLYSLKNNENFIIGLSNISRFVESLQRAGFSENLDVGERILPNFHFGPVSDFNANGKYDIHKDLPKETKYRVGLWKWKVFHGRNERIERSKLVDIPYKRFPRTFIPPPSMELIIENDSSGNKIVICDKLCNREPEYENIIHTINLFLEIFGEAEILRENLETFYVAPVKRLNWKILPEGQMPWQRLNEEVEPIINKAPKGNRVVIRDRFKTINNFNPEFVAIGQAGFDGYIVFAFPNKNLYVCESIYPDNATYIFEEKWENLSKMTKAEILNNRYQKDRIIHRKNWNKAVNNLFDCPEEVLNL